MRYVANKCSVAHHYDDASTFRRIDLDLTQAGNGLRVDGDGLSAPFLATLGTA